MGKQIKKLKKRYKEKLDALESKKWYRILMRNFKAPIFILSMSAAIGLVTYVYKQDYLTQLFNKYINSPKVMLLLFTVIFVVFGFMSIFAIFNRTALIFGHKRTKTMVNKED